MKSVLNIHWKDRCWSWSSNTLATWCEELTHWKRLWCWEGLGAGGEGDGRGWDGCMASLTRWTWVWVNSGSWWWTGRPGMLRFMGWQRVRHDWATEMNWTELNWMMNKLWRHQLTHLPLSCVRPVVTINTWALFPEWWADVLGIWNRIPLYSQDKLVLLSSSAVLSILYVLSKWLSIFLQILRKCCLVA